MKFNYRSTVSSVITLAFFRVTHVAQQFLAYEFPLFHSMTAENSKKACKKPIEDKNEKCCEIYSRKSSYLTTFLLKKVTILQFAIEKKSLSCNILRA